jgi:hypothetical protein
MSSKYQAILKSSFDKSQLEKEEQLDKRRKAANYYVSRLQGRDKWLLKRNLRRLSFHLDFDFVRKAFIDIYKLTKHDDIKELIKEIHDGTHDLTDLIEEMQDEADYNNALVKIERELLVKEFSQHLTEDNHVKEQIDLLQLKKAIRTLGN